MDAKQGMEILALMDMDMPLKMETLAGTIHEVKAINEVDTDRGYHILLSAYGNHEERPISSEDVDKKLDDVRAFISWMAEDFSKSRLSKKEIAQMAQGTLEIMKDIQKVWEQAKNGI